MACKTSFELHHNFPKLAEETGFTFNTHRPRVHVEWNKIKLINIESLVRNRNFGIVEEHLNDILDCVIDLEFDVRILDEGFLKIFRLAQLAVEYQQFCRHYLDRSVFVLKEEITNLRHELDSSKKKLKEKEEENNRIKRKMKYSRTLLPHGNENVAKMILTTLNQNKNDLIKFSPEIASLSYNKCDYCDKVFLNDFYLTSHISRRHGHIKEIPEKDKVDRSNLESELNHEILELKVKLKQMEDLILKTKPNEGTDFVNNLHNGKNTTSNDDNTKKEVRNNEAQTKDDILDKIEQWKKGEQETYNKEINLLRTQIIDIINNKEKFDHLHSENESKMMEQLNTTIKNQGVQILALKQEIQEAHVRDKEAEQKFEAQLNYWSKKAESQSTEFKHLLQKLDEVEEQSREFRALAEAEREKATELGNLLQKHLNNLEKKQVTLLSKSTMINEENMTFNEPKTQQNTFTTSNDNIILKKLQQKAQELLHFDHETSSDSSNSSDLKLLANSREYDKRILKNDNDVDILVNSETRSNNDVERNRSEIKVSKNNGKTRKNSSKSKTKARGKSEGLFYNQGSPVKVIRAKIMEEVNNRLVSVGVDPLKVQLPKATFINQRRVLQERRDIKFKKFPTREKIVNSILLHVNTAASLPHIQSIEKNDHMPSSKSSKDFSLSSVLSNVKSKAISFVKPNDPNDKPKKSYDDVSKRALAFLKGSLKGNSFSQKTPEDNEENSNYKINYQNIVKEYSGETEINDQTNIKTSKSRRSLNAINGRDDSDSSDQDLAATKEDNQVTNVLNLIKSPVRKPSDTLQTAKNDNNLEPKYKSTINVHKNNDNESCDEIESLIDFPQRKALSEENVNNFTKTKSVLKNASSTSSLNKKKVLFDMDAIQMKSLSATPSQSTTDKSDNNEQYELGITNLDTDEWDLSSIENLVLPEISEKEQKLSTSNQSLKFAELKQTIESKLIGRSEKLLSTPTGGVDVLSGPLKKTTSFGGSNTSLGSSILDDTDSSVMQKTGKH